MMSCSSPPPNDPSFDSQKPSSAEEGRRSYPLLSNINHFGAIDEDALVHAELVNQNELLSTSHINPSAGRRPRRIRLPLMLFLATCISTFWVGATHWLPNEYLTQASHLNSWMPVRRAIINYWDDGLIYMACVLAILLTHEMGHFLATIRYRIPASLPYCIPFPFSPIGTMGAVIGMEGLRADRKQMFDIGLAGPIAGLIVAIPIMWIGVQKLDLTQGDSGMYALECPLAVNMVLDYVHPPGYKPGVAIWRNQLNPYFMAGWVGLLITGLNMLPVSQLDGGHVIYTLFGKKAHWIARAFIVFTIVYMVYFNTYTWIIMVILVLFIGTDHPPTSNDSVPLGWFRFSLGCLSLLIPVLCFSPGALTMGTP